MPDPLSAIASLSELTGLAAKGFKAVSDRQPEYRLFWVEFERTLKPEYDIPWPQIHDQLWLTPEFIGLACRLMRGDQAALDEMGRWFERFVEPPDRARLSKEAIVARILDAADEASTRALRAPEAQFLQARRRLEGSIDQAAERATREVRLVADQVANSEEVILDRLGQQGQQLDQIAAQIRPDSPDPQTEIDPDALAAALAPRIAEYLEPDAEPPAVGPTAGAPAAATPAVSATEATSETPASEDTDVSLGEGRPETRPSLAELGDTAATIDELLEALASEDPDGARELRFVLAADGADALSRRLEQGDSFFIDGPLVRLVATARVLSREGEHLGAERAYLAAADLDIDDRSSVRQMVRASSMAEVRGDSDRAADLLGSAARAMPDHPAVVLAEIDKEPKAESRLTVLASVRPENPSEAAALHVKTGSAHLQLGNFDEARRALDAATAAEPENLAVGELAAVIPLVENQHRLQNREAPDRPSLREAGARLATTAELLRQRHRESDSYHVLAHAAIAYGIAGEAGAASDLLENLDPAEIPTDARVELAGAAMLAARADLAALLAPESPEDPRARLARADAMALGDDPEGREAAVRELRELLADERSDIQAQAAFALLAAAATETDVAWDEDAAKIVASQRPEVEAAMRAEATHIRGDAETAEQILLPFAAEPTALRQLRDYAAQRGDWEKAKDRSRALLKLTEAMPQDYLAHVDLVRLSGDSAGAERGYLELARSLQLPQPARETAFERAARIAGHDERLSDTHAIATEWHEAFPTSAEAVWNLLLALALQRRDEEAFALFERVRPEPRDAEEARLTASILRHAPPSAKLIETLADISDRFNRPEQLEAALLVTAVEFESSGVPLDRDLGDRIRQGFEAFPKRFPNSQLIRAVKAPGSREEFDELMRETAGEGARQQREALSGIAEGQMPVHALAAAAGRSVTATWARLTGRPLGFSMPEHDAADRSAASDAVGGAVVWDPASAVVVGLLPPDVADVIDAVFPASFTAQASASDAKEAEDRARPAGAGMEAGYDPDAETGWVREIPAEVLKRERDLLTSATERLRQFEAQPPGGPGANVELTDRLADPELSDQWKVLLTSLAVTDRLKRPLFSDDRWVRQGARALGLSTFGTVALLDVLHERGLMTSEQRTRGRVMLAEGGGWGVALSGGELIGAGKQAEWDVTGVLAGGFRDRAAWRASPVDAWHNINEFLRAAYGAIDEPHFRRWVRRALDAAIGAFPELPKSVLVESLLAFSWDLEPSGDTPSTVFFQTLVDEFKNLPPYLRDAAHDPVTGAMKRMLEAFSDPRDQAAAFRFAVARLRFPDQERMWRLFVH